MKDLTFSQRMGIEKINNIIQNIIKTKGEFISL